jgi:outer membrane protein OmpA-like peptidoglycan-associated protein
MKRLLLVLVVGGAPLVAAEPPAGKVPLCAGLTIVTAISQPDGDYESIKTIESVDTKEVRLKYSSESSPPWWSTPHPQLTQTTTHRTVLTADLEGAHRYDQIFVEKVPETSPGTTAIGTSAAVLRELKAKGESAFAICGSADDSSEMDSDRQLHQAPGGCHSYGRNTPITRVGNRPVSLRVLVDGAPVELPAIRAVRGVASEGTRDEFFFLDDERNPLTLSFRLGVDGVQALTPRERHLCETDGKKGNLTLTGDAWPPSCDLPHGGDGETLRVVQITTECMTPAATSGGGRGAGGVAGAGESSGARALEQALAEKGTADIYSIYFSFNSDTIRDESQPTLEDIAEVMRRHPDWKLRVDGHTDSVGDDAYNLDLSKRRSAAVKAALVKQYHVSPPRLTTDGYGETRPKDTNDTLDGREHNRRVELVKVG